MEAAGCDTNANLARRHQPSMQSFNQSVNPSAGPPSPFSPSHLSPPRGKQSEEEPQAGRDAACLRVSHGRMYGGKSITLHQNATTADAAAAGSGNHRQRRQPPLIPTPSHRARVFVKDGYGYGYGYGGVFVGVHNRAVKCVSEMRCDGLTDRFSRQGLRVSRGCAWSPGPPTTASEYQGKVGP